ncbi:MAG: trimeric intracellular cation channel family protein [Clostridia bacterium]|nr:trimeric intracellular cation channel family protein [Clostridia bacterium]
MNTWILLITEIIGTVSFSLSGALVGVGCGLDMMGVLLVGCITATGGGILRDVLLGRFPPAIFQNWHLALIAAVTALAVFWISYANRRHFDRMRTGVERINNIFDAMGLASFSVMGVESVCRGNYDENVFLVLTISTLYGVGGGIIRDILTDSIPYVFKKRIYMTAALAGSALYYVLRRMGVELLLSTILAMLLVFSVRMLATKFHWRLPVVPLESNGRNEKKPPESK